MINQKTYKGGTKKLTTLKDKQLGYIKNLNLLLEHYDNISTETKIPTKVVAYTLSAELTSKTIIDFCKTIPPLDTKNVKANDLISLQKQIPEKLYFFLWRLKNNAEIPIEGVLNSIELRKAIYALIRTIQILQHFAKKYQSIPDIQEMCGFIYLDLAGLAYHTRNGVFLNGLMLHYHKLVRKAIKCFQTGIKICRKQGEKIDSQHYSIFDTLHEQYNTDERRINMYLNPWHFIYIACSLKALNDEKIASLYLHRARTIIDNIAVNQNPRVISQKELLEAIYTIIDMSKKNLMLPKNNIRQLQKSINRINKKNKGHKEKFYSPIIETELLRQLSLQQKQVSKGTLPDDFKMYLSGIYSLYNAIPFSSQRNKIIFRLNLSPVKLHNAPIAKSISKLSQKNSGSRKLQLVRGNSYRKAS